MNNDHTVITFKADPSLTKMLQGVSNRSEFIRSALLSAFDNLCPFCKGSGVLSPHKREHLEQVSEHLKIDDCNECDAEGVVFQRSKK